MHYGYTKCAPMAFCFVGPISLWEIEKQNYYFLRNFEVKSSSKAMYITLYYQTHDVKDYQQNIVYW